MERGIDMSKVITKEVKSAVAKLNSIQEELSSYIKEKEEVFNVIKLALVAKRNSFFLGATGQAKTYVVKEFVKRIEGAKFYETLMSKQKDEEQLFARLDIAKYAQGTVDIITKDKLLEGDICFLDELFKSGDAILNSLLTYLNGEDVNIEGITIQNKGIATFTASNEIPDFTKEEDKILKPLYDRLHLKLVTEYIKEKDNFKDAVRAKRARVAAAMNNTMDLSELKLLNEKVWEVEVPDSIDDLVWEICNKIYEKTSYTVSDRKKLEYSILIQANALLNNRDKALPEDLVVLKYYLWEKVEDAPIINDIINSCIKNPLKDKILGLKTTATEIVEEAVREVTKLGEGVKDKKTKMKALKKAKNELIQLHTMLEETELEATRDEDKELIKENFKYFEEIYEKLTISFGYTYRPLAEEKEMADI